MGRLIWVAAVVVAGSGCFSRPELRPSDAGVSDGNADDGAGDDAPIDAACMPAEDPPDVQLDQLAFDHVSAGYFHVCAIDTAGAMWCWGSNDHGQLGLRTDSPGDQTGKPGLASTIMGWTAVSASADHTCGVANGKVYCWGRNDSHQSSPGGNGGDLQPAEVVLTSLLVATEVPTKVFAGSVASCAITNMNRAMCWGDVNLTVAGGTPEARVMTAVGGNATWSTMSIGEDHGCALSTAGHIYCWGENDAMQLGIVDTGTTRTFAQLAERDLTNTFTSISVARDATCATHTSGDLVCFGSRGSGHLGDVGAGVDDDQVVSTGTWNRVSINLNHVCAAKANNEVYCYGDSPDGALGGGDFVSSRTIQSVVATNIAEIAAGERFSCALDTTHHLSCWGVNSHGELGLGDIATKRDPSVALLPIGTCESVFQVVSGDRHTCAIVGTPPATAGRAYCWGSNTERQVTGTSTEVSISKPMQLFPTETFSRLAAGQTHTCGLRSDGAIRCWGNNDADQLGAGGTGPTLLMPVGGMPWIYVAAGSTTSCAIRMGGELFCWGTIPITGTKATPFNLGRVTTGGTKNWTTIALGSAFGVGTAIDPATPNRVYIYGFAESGCQLGQASGAAPTAPHELYNSVHVRANVSAAQANGAHLCIHMNDVSSTNKVTCYGSNQSHQVSQTADTTCIGPEDPTAPPGGWRMAFPDASTVTVSRSHSCALDAIGHPYCWGANNTAELGDLGSITAAPTEVTTQRFAELSTGADHTCGISDTRTNVSCWGENRDGQLGDNARFHAAPTPAGLVPQ